MICSSAARLSSGKETPPTFFVTGPGWSASFPAVVHVSSVNRPPKFIRQVLLAALRSSKQVRGGQVGDDWLVPLEETLKAALDAKMLETQAHTAPPLSRREYLAHGALGLCGSRQSSLDLSINRRLSLEESSRGGRQWICAIN